MSWCHSSRNSVAKQQWSMMKRPKSISAGFSIDYVGDASKRYADENVHFSCFHQCSYAAQKTHESVRHTQVWVHTLKIFNHTATCFQNPSFALYVCSPNWSTDTVVPRSEWWQTGHLPWSYLACWVRFSTCRTYQLRFPVGSCLAGRQSAPHVLVPFE